MSSSSVGGGAAGTCGGADDLDGSCVALFDGFGDFWTGIGDLGALRIPEMILKVKERARNHG